jgi:YD repeat-containing protein
MFRLTFTTGNEAFEDEPNREAARILREIARTLERGDSYGYAYDHNGNRVGEFSLTQTEA